MNKDYYTNINFGKTLPLNNTHAFSVSMPTIKDVIDFEEGESKSLEIVKSAYPRLFVHPFIKIICEYLKKELNRPNSHIFILPDQYSAEEVANLSETQPEYFELGKYAIAVFTPEQEDDAINYFAFMKHTGIMIFSREAEDILKLLEIKFPGCEETPDYNSSEKIITDILKDGYGESSIYICNTGMNAIYCGYKELMSYSYTDERNIIILFGWAYSDTISILKKSSCELVMIPDVYNTEALEDILNEQGDSVAAVYFETVSNPLIAVPDIPYIYELSKKYGFKTMCDNTFATPWNVSISKYCDIIFESLTKYASGSGDVMAGAVIIPETSRIDSTVAFRINSSLIPLYKKDIGHLAKKIKGYKKRVETVSLNTKRLYKELLNNNKIESIYSTEADTSRVNWDKIKRSERSVCGVVSIIPKGDIASFYDRLELPKGPSLGTEFPIIMPYTLLAHFAETRSEEGKLYLKKMGLSPDLIRISVGIDDPDLITNAMK